MGILVAVSQVADGSMYDRAAPSDGSVIARREAWLARHGLGLDRATRVHIVYEGEDYRRYRTVGAADLGAGMRDGDLPAADALVVTEPGHALFLPVADCVATAIHDPVRQVAMLSHLGRHSLEQDGGVASVEYLVREHGSDPADLRVWLSPAPSKAGYPIHRLGGAGMKEATLAQLTRAGVPAVQIVDDPAETDLDPRYYSHSAFLQGRQPDDGRFAMVLALTA